MKDIYELEYREMYECTFAAATYIGRPSNAQIIQAVRNHRGDGYAKNMARYMAKLNGELFKEHNDYRLIKVETIIGEGE